MSISCCRRIPTLKPGAKQLVHRANFDTTNEQRMRDPDHVPVECGAQVPGQFWAVCNVDVTCLECLDIDPVALALEVAEDYE